MLARAGCRTRSISASIESKIQMFTEIKKWKNYFSPKNIMVSSKMRELDKRAIGKILMSEREGDKTVRLTSIRTLEYLPGTFPPALLQAIDGEKDENTKRMLLSTLTGKKGMRGIHSVALMEGAKRGLPNISEAQLKAIITGELSSFRVESLLDQSPLSFSLPSMDKNSSRYKACMGVFSGYTEMFFPGFAKKLQSFAEKFIAKENSAHSWSIMLEMETSYRNVASSSMSGTVSFIDDVYHHLQEQYSQRVNRSFYDSEREVGNENPAKRFKDDLVDFADEEEEESFESEESV
jgi:hypothetical protein